MPDVRPRANEKPPTARGRCVCVPPRGALPGYTYAQMGRPSATQGKSDYVCGETTLRRKKKPPRAAREAGNFIH